LGHNVRRIAIKHLFVSPSIKEVYVPARLSVISFVSGVVLAS